MKWGIGSYTLPWHVGIGDFRPKQPMDAFGLLQVAIDHQARVVQYCENLPITDLDDRERDELARRASDHGIQIEVGTRGLDMDEVQRCVDLALRFGSSFVRIVVDRPGDEPTPSELIARLAGFSPMFRSSGLRLAIENHDRFSASVLRDIVGQAGEDWVGICFDTANSLGCLEGPRAGLEALLPHVVSLHLKDVVARREFHMLGFRVVGTPVGEGSAHLNEVASLVSTAHPEVNAIVEHWLAPCETIEETLEVEAEWARRSCATVRSWFASG